MDTHGIKDGYWYTMYFAESIFQNHLYGLHFLSAWPNSYKETTENKTMDERQTTNVD
jgi:hypothetical protein